MKKENNGGKSGKMTRIELKHGYCVDVEPLCYTLKKCYKGKNKNGEHKDVEKICGYIGMMRAAIEKYIYLDRLGKMNDLTVSFAKYADMVDNASKAAVRGLESVLEQFPVK